MFWDICLIVVSFLLVLCNLAFLIWYIVKKLIMRTKEVPELSEETGEETAGLPEDILVAILTAAATTVLGQSENKKFRVVSFRRLK